jgi:Arc/MetJ-type ribon-helix-helix transcriptional regulator
MQAADDQLEILLPDDARRLAREQVDRGAYGSVREYVANLIRQDSLRQQNEEEVLRKRLASGPPVEMTDADFHNIRRRLEGEIARRRVD